MALSTSVNVSGGWHTVTSVYVKVSGVWTFTKQIWAKVSGTWELVFAALQPFTQDYTTPGSFSTTVPFGAVQLVVGVTGGGQSGSYNASGFVTFPLGGGSAGGTAQRTISLVAADWGTTLNLFVGTGGAPNTSSQGDAGTNSTFAVTVNAGSFSMTGGGAPANNTVGGSASGGTTNTTGQTRQANSQGGSSVWAAGGTSSSPGNPGSLGSGGGGSNNGGAGTSGGSGGNGRVKLDWS